MNQVEVISSLEVIIKREKGNTIVDASYETRAPLFANIDAVVMFKDLQEKITK